MFWKKKSDDPKPPVIKKRQRWSRFTGNGNEREYFIDNLSMLLASGMDILSALDAIQLGVRSKLMKGIIDDLKMDINDGRPLWRSLKDTRLVSQHILSLFRVGEESGKLAENLKVINAQQQKERTFRSKINSAMMYPVMVLSLTFIVGVGIAWFILPRLSIVFVQLHMELPSITKALIGFGVFLGEYGTIAVPLFVMSIFGVLFLVFMNPKTRWIGQWLLFHTPVIKTVIQEIELSRFGYILGNLLEAGLPIVDSLHSLSRATSFSAYSKLYLHLEQCINEGDSFQESFEKYSKIQSLMPPTIQQMLVSGEQSGNLSFMLHKIGTTFEEKTETSTKNLAVMLEPMLLVIVWGGVVTVALAVILPIYSLIGGLNDPQGQVTKASTPPPVEQLIEKAEEVVPVEMNRSLKIIEDTSYLNVREVPQGTIIAKAYPGEEYEYLQEDSGWYEIIFDEDTVGWVSGDYVTLVQKNNENSLAAEIVANAVAEATIPMVEILPTGFGYLNVRQAPHDTVIGTVTPGQQYPLLDENDGWYQVRFAENKEGWVSGTYVKPIPDAAE